MKRAISFIDRALKDLYNLQSPLRAEDFVLTLPAESKKTQTGMLLVQPPSGADDSLGLAIYLGGAVRETLDALPEKGPWNFSQLAAFSVAAEEVSHFHYVAHFAPQGRGVSQIELEFQGEIDKFLISHFATELAPQILLEQFFESFRWLETLGEEERARYEEANRLAKSFLQRHAHELAGAQTREKFLKLLRSFYRLSFEEKVSRAMR